MSQNEQSQQILNVGRDPRMLPEYEALRAEINKLSHASRPEVDWVRIHKLASQIFEKHGVDLQTAIYFTLARSRIEGLSGFTEGCEFLANLIVTQWESFWPPVHQERARVEIFDWFIARISEVIRRYQISNDDKQLVYRCERALQLISEKLHNVGLSRIPRVENLVHFIEGYTHLFNEAEIVIVSDKADLKDKFQFPSMIIFKSVIKQDQRSSSAATNSHLLQNQVHTLVKHEKAQVKPTEIKTEPHRKPHSAWFGFVCGVLSCALPVMGWLGWQHHQQQQEHAVARLLQPAAGLPPALSHEDVNKAREVLGDKAVQEMENELVSRYQEQLEQVEQASPLYWYHYGEGLRNTLQMLYPDSMAVKAIDKQWQNSLNSQEVGSNDQLPDYLNARARVDALINKLLELEEQRKSVTISYLKSQLYEVQKNLMQEVPLNFRLNKLESKKASMEPLSEAELKVLESDLKALNIRLYQLRQETVGG